MLLAACAGGGGGQGSPAVADVPELVEVLEAVPDPRGLQGRRYRLAMLLALGVCAMSAPGHDSVAAIAQCGPSYDGLGCWADPMTRKPTA